MLRSTRNIRLLVLQKDAVADEDALAFPQHQLNLENESLPHEENYKAQLLSSINWKNKFLVLCCTIFFDPDQNYRNTKLLVPMAIIICKNGFLLNINKNVTNLFPRKSLKI